MSAVETASNEQLESRVAELCDLIDLKERMTDGSLERELSEVTRERLVREQRERTERVTALREYEQASAAYETARNETLEAMRGYVEAAARARELRQTVNDAFRRCEKVGTPEGETLPVKPDRASIVAHRNPAVRDLFRALRTTTSSDF